MQLSDNESKRRSDRVRLSIAREILLPPRDADALVEALATVGELTCRACQDNGDCRSAFDVYNTDGDCLEET